MRTVPASQMRVSDAERERVASFLREQSLEGRLDHEELEERIGRCYRAVTVGDLESLIVDLPHRRVPAASRQPARRRRNGPPLALIPVGIAALAALSVPTLVFVMAATVIALGVAAVAALFALGFVFGPFILIGLLIVAATRRRRHYHHHHRHWDPRWR
jgi:hypothetical protein